MPIRPARLKLFFDGGCRPNPGMMETGVVARGVFHHRADVGHGTNTDAEWLAAIDALYIAQVSGKADIELVGDSALVVNQANGVWKCRDAGLREHLMKFRALAANFGGVRVRHIKRSQNLAGIALDRMRHSHSIVPGGFDV